MKFRRKAVEEKMKFTVKERRVNGSQIVEGVRDCFGVTTGSRNDR